MGICSLVNGDNRGKSGDTSLPKLPILPKYPRPAAVKWSHRALPGLTMLVLSAVLVTGPVATAEVAVLDYADRVVHESNVSGGNLDIYFTQWDTLAVGVTGAVTDSNDAYRVTVGDGGYLELKLEASGELSQTTTALAAGVDGLVYFAAGNSIWRRRVGDPNELVEMLVSAEQLAEAAGAMASEDLRVNDLAVAPEPNGAVLVVLSESGYVLSIDAVSGEVTGHDPNIAAHTAAQFQTADLVGIAIDATEKIYVVDAVSESILEISSDLGESSMYTDHDVLVAAVRRDILAAIGAGNAALPSTVLAQTEEEFPASSLGIGAGDYPAGYYASLYGDALGGDGSITRIEPNETDPCMAVFTRFFDPALNVVVFIDPENVIEPDPNLLNLSALAFDLSSEGGFDNKMFVGTFGDNLGDFLDGKVFVAEPNGDLHEFVTAFVDSDGEQVFMTGLPIIDPCTGDQEIDPDTGQARTDANEVAVSGFFDVTDMAFPVDRETGFGDYLYVLSENIDNNGPDQAGGFNSDLWRVDAAGVAELFVGDIADGVIALAFGPGTFGGDLYVATWSDPGQIIRVRSDGTFETFMQFTAGHMCSDIAFSSAQSEFGEGLFLTLQEGQATSVVVIYANGNSEVLATNLNTGDVSSGDLVFDSERNLVVVQAGDRNLLRLDYQELFDYSIDDLAVGADTSNIVATYAPYVMVKSARRRLIMQLAPSGNAGDVVTVVDPRNFGIYQDDDTTAAPTFAFDGGGDIYIYYSDLAGLYSSPRGQDMTFSPTGVTLDPTLEIGANLFDPQISHLTWAGDGSLLAHGLTRLPDPNDEDVEEPNGSFLEEAIVLLGNTESGVYRPRALVEQGQIPHIVLAVSGPGVNVGAFEATAGTLLEKAFSGLDAGSYTLTLTPVGDSNEPIDYNFVVSLAPFATSHIFHSGNSPVRLDMLTPDGGMEQLVLDYDGPGYGVLAFDHRPGAGVVLETDKLTIADSSASSSVEVSAGNGAGDLVLDEIVLDGSLGELTFAGQLDRITATAGTRGVVKNVTLGQVRAVHALDYLFQNFYADAMGNADNEFNMFDAVGLSSLVVGEDVINVLFLDPNSTNAASSPNRYKRIEVGGVVAGSEFHGAGLDELLVKNTLGQEVAVDDTRFWMVVKGAAMNDARILQGDVNGSTFYATKRIRRFEVDDGDMNGSTVWSNSKIDYAYVSGDVDSESTFQAAGTLSGGINRLICGGELAGTVSAIRLNEMMVGFDEQGRRLVEDEEFTGSDFTGSASGTLSIGGINVTGAIRGGSLTTQYFSIGSVFAEDGLEDVTISAKKKVKYVVVGCLNGDYRKIVNPEADVSGAISARSLGRMFYTGQLADNMRLPAKVGFIQDGIPGD